jgi:hypothetical protein
MKVVGIVKTNRALNYQKWPKIIFKVNIALKQQILGVLGNFRPFLKVYHSSFFNSHNFHEADSVVG